MELVRARLQSVCDNRDFRQGAGFSRAANVEKISEALASRKDFRAFAGVAPLRCSRVRSFHPLSNTLIQGTA